MGEWPGTTPRFDEVAEFWTYQAALDARIYLRETVEPPRGPALTAAALYDSCWPSGQDTVVTEDMERYARAVWPDLSRPRLEVVLLEGLQGGQWAVWKRGADEAFYTAEDLLSAVRVGPDWVLVAPQSKTAGDLDGIRPGRVPQPVSHTGTPREVLVKIWEELGGYKEVAFTELAITATDRDTLDDTLLATWADRPTAAQVHASIRAAGQREVDGKAETVRGYSANVTETCEGELNLIVDVQVEPATMADNAYLKEAVQNSEAVLEGRAQEISADGAYYSEENETYAKEEDQEIHYTGFPGKPGRFDYERTEDGVV
jgi:hypothetical protein